MNKKNIVDFERRNLPKAITKPLKLDYTSCLNDQDSEDRKFITALARGLEVLRAFQSCIGPMSNKDLSDATGIPKPTITRLTYTLMELGYLRQVSPNGKYELGVSVLSLGYPLLSSSRIRHVAHDHMAELAKLGRCSVLLAARYQLNMVCIDECCGNSATSLRVDIGARIEIAKSALGRAYIAGVNDVEREQLFLELEDFYKEEWPNVRSRIMDAIQQIRERGFCLVDGEWRRNTRTVAVPLVSDDGKTVVSMSCGGPTFSVSVENLENDLGPRLVHISQADSMFLSR